MKSLIDTYKKTRTLHHACLLEGDKENIFTELRDFLENEMNFPVKGNPDFWYGEFDTFGIDDGRGIKELQTRKAVMHERKIFIISANFFTTEAQNSLLKVFEEPTEGTHFFIITQNADTLLPTLRSRMFILPKTALGNCQGRSLEYLVDTKEFLKSSKARRLELLKSIIEEKNKSTAISFLNNLEEVLYKKFQGRSLELVSVSLEEIIRCKKYLNGRSSSVKMLLEHLALVVPKVEV